MNITIKTICGGNFGRSNQITNSKSMSEYNYFEKKSVSLYIKISKQMWRRKIPINLSKTGLMRK